MNSKTNNNCKEHLEHKLKILLEEKSRLNGLQYSLSMKINAIESELKDLPK